MSLNNAIQHLASGTAALYSGYLIKQVPGAPVRGFDLVGALACVLVLIAIAVSKNVKVVDRRPNR